MKHFYSVVQYDTIFFSEYHKKLYESNKFRTERKRIALNIKYPTEQKPKTSKMALNEESYLKLRGNSAAKFLREFYMQELSIKEKYRKKLLRGRKSVENVKNYLKRNKN